MGDNGRNGKEKDQEQHALAGPFGDPARPSAPHLPGKSIRSARRVWLQSGGCSTDRPSPRLILAYGARSRFTFATLEDEALDNLDEDHALKCDAG
jgi:hypothetical protein